MNLIEVKEGKCAKNYMILIFKYYLDNMFVYVKKYYNKLMDIIYEEFYFDKEMKRVIGKHWYKDGKLHRKNGPALISYFKDGSVKTKGWYQNGELFRENGPAIEFFEKENI